MQAANLEETSRGCHIYQGGLCIIISFTECRSVICVFGNNAGPAPAVCNGFGETGRPGETGRGGFNSENRNTRSDTPRTHTPPPLLLRRGSGRSAVPTAARGLAPRRPLRGQPRLFKRRDRHLVCPRPGSGGCAERGPPGGVGAARSLRYLRRDNGALLAPGQ